jgi:RNA polymerase subunit RPABC4/transcription elongation factor Spt4
MARKQCPHCGDVVSADELVCSCGFAFSFGSEVQGAKAARDTSAKILDTGQRKAAAARRRQAQRKAARKTATKKPARKVRAKIVDHDSGVIVSSRLMECPSCMAEISKRAAQCPKCGQQPFAECKVCGAKIRVNSSVCPGCGDPDPFNA